MQKPLSELEPVHARGVSACTRASPKAANAVGFVNQVHCDVAIASETSMALPKSLDRSMGAEARCRHLQPVHRLFAEAIASSGVGQPRRNFGAIETPPGSRKLVWQPR